jgi:PKD repeat protein
MVRTDRGITTTTTVNTAPTANAGADRSGNQTEPFYFDGSLSTDDMAIVNYTWEFGDGSLGYDVHPDHFYHVPGAYDCKLTVRDSFGLEATHQIKVTVLDNIPPVAEAGDDVEIVEGESFHLDAFGSSDNVGITEYRWIFDDTVVGLGPSLTYTFETYGTYSITLLVLDDAGNHATDTLSVIVSDTIPPNADAGPDSTGALVTETHQMRRSQVTAMAKAVRTS